MGPLQYDRERVNSEEERQGAVQARYQALIWLLSEPVNLFLMPAQEAVLTLLSAGGIAVISLVAVNAYTLDSLQAKEGTNP
ncbi:hypothetical protein [Paenibacillus sp. FSL H8-457]|uniref:hypothetical protein n=1 Tax=Paenibacillus sp. FSL H8-457 TaxID=1227351 RepID=UPI0012DD95CE|nr:hypothetical protein [Paenibacillus sp. FSL H8-457]